MKKYILLISLLVPSKLFPLTFDLYYATFLADTSIADTSKSILDYQSISPDSIADSAHIKKPVVINTISNESFLDYTLKSFSLTSEHILKTDYRSTENILELLPASFLQDLGSPGQPGEILFYGLGNGNVSHSFDGLNVNNRWKNSIDLHYIQSESFDSLELLPLTSGFL